MAELNPTPSGMSPRACRVDWVCGFVPIKPARF